MTLDGLEIPIAHLDRFTNVLLIYPGIRVTYIHKQDAGTVQTLGPDVSLLVPGGHFLLITGEQVLLIPGGQFLFILGGQTETKPISTCSNSSLLNM